jgi:hypothetical protein
LRFEVRDEDLQRAWTAIRERVNATNRMYGEMLVPRDRAGERGEDARRDGVDETRPLRAFSDTLRSQRTNRVRAVCALLVRSGAKESRLPSQRIKTAQFRCIA